MRKLLKNPEIAWIGIDVGNSAFATSILATLFPIFFSGVVPAEGVNLFGWTSTGLSIWGYAVSGSALTTLVASLLIGSWADRSNQRKLCFLLFSLLGASATCSLAFLDSWQSLIMGFIFANVGFAGSIVFSNSLLPFVTQEKQWDSLSLRAYGWGYISGGIILALHLLLIMKFSWFQLDSAATATRVCFFSVGIWWFLWSIPCYWTVREQGKVPAAFTLKDQWRNIVSTLKELPQRPVILWFIFAYFFANEGVQTVIAMSSPFAREALQLDQNHIIGTFLIIQIIGWPLTLGMSPLARRYGALRVFQWALAAWVLIVSYAFFMTNSVDFLILGLLVAVVLGVSQAIPRSIYARLVPRGKEAEYFSLYGLSGRSNPILGPVIFSVIADTFGSPRVAIVSLGSFFLISLILLQFVSVDRSLRD